LPPTKKARRLDYCEAGALSLRSIEAMADPKPTLLAGKDGSELRSMLLRS
jgi:hypothetical protein